MVALDENAKRSFSWHCGFLPFLPRCYKTLARFVEQSFREHTVRISILSCLFILSLTGLQPAAASNDIQAPAERANAHAKRIGDPKEYLAEIDRTLALAYSGQYGQLKRGSEHRLQTARDRIAEVLEARPITASELPLEDRIAIHNAQEMIDSILRRQDKDRMVCRREAKTGSRLATTECLTVAEREARAGAASESTAKVQRNICYPGEGQDCN